MTTKTTSHRVTLERIKQTRVCESIAAEKNDPRIACRREFRREQTNQRVEFSLICPEGRRLATGSAILVDYSPQGAQLSHIIFDDGFWPDGDFVVSFRVTGGPYEGVTAYGTPLRFAASRANLALQFDGLYVKL
ncbi:MAG: hypothetical protein KF754_02225 [Planctomycetes bacterium]|nr:hypothetical protein [Planctomycetota bacterium]